MNYNYNYNRRGNDSRFVGGFFGPFILGGITGGLVAPLFYNNNRPVYYSPYPYPYYMPYPYYR